MNTFGGWTSEYGFSFKGSVSAQSVSDYKTYKAVSRIENYLEKLKKSFYQLKSCLISPGLACAAASRLFLWLRNRSTVPMAFYFFHLAAYSLTTTMGSSSIRRGDVSVNSVRTLFALHDAAMISAHSIFGEQSLLDPTPYG